MPDFQVIRKSDVPQPGRFGPNGDRTLPPTARLHSNGALYLSVLATQALSDRTCLLLAEFDPASCVLRFTAIPDPGDIPWGLSESECFWLRVRKPKHGAQPHAALAVHALFKHIGFKRNGAQTFEVVEIDAAKHSISIVLPAQQFQESCDGSSH